MNDGTLPKDLDACHRMIQRLSAEREQLAAQLAQQDRDVQAREAFVEEQARAGG